jgi:hypothetical protein
VNLSASELTRRATVELPVGTAHSILQGIGIHVPRINTHEGISDALEWDIPKLAPEQIKQFVAEAYRHG